MEKLKGMLQGKDCAFFSLKLLNIALCFTPYIIFLVLFMISNVLGDVFAKLSEYCSNVHVNLSHMYMLWNFALVTFVFLILFAIEVIREW